MSGQRKVSKNSARKLKPGEIATIEALKRHARWFATGLVRVPREKALAHHRRVLIVRASKLRLAA